MPTVFTTFNLQYRGHAASVPEARLHREFSKFGASAFHPAGLYALETALHEWLLDSPLRTTDAAAAHLFYVPIYLSSLFVFPTYGYAAEPREWLSGQAHAPGKMLQGTLLMRHALRYIQSAFPWWNASGGRDHVWLMLHDEGPCLAPREIRPSILLTHYGYHAQAPKEYTAQNIDRWLSDAASYRRLIGDPKHPTRCFTPGKDLVVPPWKVPAFWARAFNNKGLQNPHRPRSIYVYFAGELGAGRAIGYSRDLRQRAYSMLCDPSTLAKQGARSCSPHKGGCRPDLPLTCAKWRPGVKIVPRTERYHLDLLDATFCLAFPGDGWSGRVLDAVVHGCVPVVIEDESLMFFEGTFADVGFPLDYANFSLRLPEAQLPSLLTVLDGVAPARVRSLQRALRDVRDYFVYKDAYAPYTYQRKALLGTGRKGQDAFLLLALALEARARSLGKLVEPRQRWLRRNRALMEADREGESPSTFLRAVADT